MCLGSDLSMCSSSEAWCAQYYAGPLLKLLAARGIGACQGTAGQVAMRALHRGVSVLRRHVQTILLQLGP